MNYTYQHYNKEYSYGSKNDENVAPDGTESATLIRQSCVKSVADTQSAADLFSRENHEIIR